MKTKLLCSLVVLISLSGCALTRVSEPKEVPIADVVEIVKDTLYDTDLHLTTLQFDSADVSLETVAKESKTNSVEFWIVSAEASVSDAYTQTVSFTLREKPKALAAPKASEALKAAIEKAQADLDQALAASKLEVTQLSASVKFAVDVTGTGGAKGDVKIIPITVGAKTSATRSASHSIKLNFKKPEPKPDLCKQQKECLAPLFEKLNTPPPK